MRTFALAASLLALLSVRQAAAISLLSDPNPSPPACGLSCTMHYVLESSSCSLTNISCICDDGPLNDLVTLCVTQNCTVHEQLQMKNYSMTSCGYQTRDRSTLIWLIPAIFGPAAVIAFGCRIMARVLVSFETWGWDDTIMVVTMVRVHTARSHVCFVAADTRACQFLVIPLQIFSGPLSQLGLGRDIWTITPKNITGILYLYYWDELLYLAALPMTKISILLFYRRIFPSPFFRRAVWLLIGCNVGYLIAFNIVSVYQCSPLEGAWKAWDGTVQAHCRDINAQSWAAAIINIALDLATIILPLPELSKIRLSIAKKFQVLLMFSLGFFVTIVSAIRLSSLQQYGTTTNFTQDYTEIGYWSTIEVAVGVVCACLPAVRALFGHILPGVFGTTVRDKSEYIQQRDVFSTQRSRQADIVVKQQWTVSSRSREESSVIELDVMPSLDDQGEDSHVGEKKATIPRESV
ncbi:cfem domain containing protein [Grosmannia clavigera kw1407]|uniref:Cfem domain containing protein n=1 Tax=Grosmannia clavigera (strain kw1407 / UAMH 11150) TaxID=655863 RepID=F0X6W7_GROCL|nr:cfem domain containing protein [Grosmannia clavigera kw1407]EFX06568.1 cfem domain containing protein [Grosmannia clavigera kw1407]